MRINLRRANSRLPIFTVLFAVVLTVGASSLAVGGRYTPQSRPANAAGAPLPAGVIVRVDVTGSDDTGPKSASAYGIVVDPTGLVLAPANVVDPLAPGVAVGWQWPFVGFKVSQIVVSTSAGAGLPFAPAYVATVAATDGLLDATVLKLSAAIGATGTATPVPPNSLNLPALPIAAADPAVGATITYASYPETGTTASGLGTYTETPGTVVAIQTDPHITGKNYWINFDIPTPVAYPGGAVVDATGALVSMASWLPDSPPQSLYGPDAVTIAPVVAAAKAGTPYVSPYIIAGTGAEAAVATGFGSGSTPCSSTTPLTSYPTGTSAVIAMFSYSGFTNGEDAMDFWFDPDKQQLLGYGLNQWTAGVSGPCYANQLSNDGTALPDGKYAYNLFAGGDLHFIQSATTTIGQPGVGSVHVTGRVLDADTGKPINFVFVYILKPGVDPQTWLNGGAQTDVASSGVTDATGVYSTDPAIVPGPYPFVVIPNDNHQVVGGTVTIPADGKMPDISLTASN